MCFVNYTNAKENIIFRDNVVFQEINAVSMTQAQWLFTFVIDMAPFNKAVRLTESNLITVEKSIRQSMYRYTRVDEMYYITSLSRLLKDVIHLRKDLALISKEYDKILYFYQEQYIDNSPVTTSRPLRNRRSVLPFVGSIAKFLFGLSTEKDLSKIKNAVRQLAKDQNQVKHIVRQNLSILNVTRSEVKENRHALNNVIEGLKQTNADLLNVTSYFTNRFNTLEKFVINYLHTNLVIQENRETIQKAFSYLTLLNNQINSLAAGVLPQSLIDPHQLKATLASVKRKIPNNLMLPFDYNSDIWSYYKHLKSALVFRENKFLIITSLHLNDIKSQFKIFRIVNIPIGYQNISAIATYKLTHEHIAVSIDHSKYILLSKSEANLCTHNTLKLCAHDQAIYTFHNTKNCIASLFMNKGFFQNCKTIIRTDIHLPKAIYLSLGSWIVSLVKPLTLTIVCGNNNKQQLLVKPFFKIIHLASGCYGYGDEVIIPSYFLATSQSHLLNNYATMMSPYNQSEIPTIWRPINPFINAKLNVPKKLEKIHEIPMNSLIDKLREENFSKLYKDDKNKWNWDRIVLIISALIAGLIFGYLIFSKLCFKYFRPFLHLCDKQTQNSIMSNQPRPCSADDKTDNASRKDKPLHVIIADKPTAEAPGTSVLEMHQLQAQDCVSICQSANKMRELAN